MQLVLRYLYRRAEVSVGSPLQRTNHLVMIGRDHLREFPLEMIFNIVYHTPDTMTRTPEADAEGFNGNGLSIEVQMAWGGSSIYNFQVLNDNLRTYSSGRL